MRNLILLLVFAFSYPKMAISQNLPYNLQENFLIANRYWVLTQNLGVHFKPSGPEIEPTAMKSTEGTAAVSDPATGELLFYSSGSQIWNADHQIMQNGDKLLGNGSGSVINSTTQGVCIVPVIDSPNKYYVFSLQGPTNWFKSGSVSRPSDPTLYYSIVDMGLDNGKGAVVPSRKNVVLDTAVLSESMIAIPGDNCDIWLLVHAYQRGEFKAFRITKDGIDTNAVQSVVGHPETNNLRRLMGSMAVSPNRQLISFGFVGYVPLNYPGGGLLYKFDPATGVVSEPILFSKGQSGGFYGTSFSPDSKKLYTNEYISDPQMPNYLVQYDLSNYDSASVVSSRTQLEVPRITKGYQMKLYDEKVYFLQLNNNVGSWLGSINQPNQSGPAADVVPDAIVFAKGQPISGYSLPNEVVFPLFPDTSKQNVLDTSLCSTKLELHAPAGFKKYLWSNGTSETQTDISASGTYWVLYGDGCNYSIDSFSVLFHEVPTPVINVEGFDLSTTLTYSSYQWLLNGNPIAGATSRKYSVTENGDYQVVVANEHDCVDTSEVYEVTNVTSINGNRLSTKAVMVYPNPAKDMIHIHSSEKVDVRLLSIDGKLLHETKNAGKINIGDLSNGLYYLQIFDKYDRLIKVEKLLINR